MQDIGKNIKACCRSFTRKNVVKRALISSIYGNDLLLLTPLLKKYLEMGLVVTNIETVIIYQGKEVFEWFHI